MGITSIGFILFIALAMILYYIVPGKMQYFILLGAGVVFYLTYGIKYVPFVLVNTVAVYAGARILGSRELKHRRPILVLVLLISLGMLAYTKYTNFILSALNSLMRSERFQMVELIMPLGVSFYTFMSIGYLLDVYWKKYEPERNFFKYATFVLYFPHIIQGPISRYNKLAPQLFERKTYDFQRMVSGGEQILWGFFLKLVIANRLDILVSNAFADYTSYAGVIWLVVLALYSVQIYADFMGCMEIARGVSLLFGIELEKNFDHPYFSKSIPEFWRRWHMTLGSWFKDYLFLPVSNSSFVKRTSKKLGKKYGPKARKNFISCFSVAVVWLATGLWHGAAWRFIAWGMYHGCLTIGSTLFEDKIKKLTKFLRIDTGTKSWELFQMMRTFLLCCLGRALFRAPSLREGLLIIKRLFMRPELWRLVDGSLFNMGLNRPNFALAMICILILWCVSMLQEKGSVRQMFNKQNLVFRFVVLYVAIFSVMIFGLYGPGYDASAFIYEQF